MPRKYEVSSDRQKSSSTQADADYLAALAAEEAYCKEHHRHPAGHRYDREPEEFDWAFEDPSLVPSSKDVCYWCTAAKPSAYPTYRTCVECGFGGPIKSKGLYTCKMCGEAYCNAVCRDIHRGSGCMSYDGK